MAFSINSKLNLVYDDMVLFSGDNCDFIIKINIKSINNIVKKCGGQVIRYNLPGLNEYIFITLADAEKARDILNAKLLGEKLQK